MLAILELETIEEACVEKLKDNEGQNCSKIQSRRSSQFSQSFSMSDSTFYWSDSDDSERDEHFLQSEYKRELKRKRALYNSTREGESQLYVPEENQSTESSLVGFESVCKEFNGDESWFCPCFEPPLECEIDQKFIANNDPIVQFYKKAKKFKLVRLNREKVLCSLMKILFFFSIQRF